MGGRGSMRGAVNLGRKAAGSIPHKFERNKSKTFTHFETVILILIKPEV